MMFDFIACAISNLFRMYLIYRFVRTFLGRAKVDKKIELLAYAFFFVVNTALFWAFHLAWVNVASNLLGIGILVRMYTKSVKTNMFVTSAIYLVNCGCDIVVTLPFVEYQDGVAHSQVYAVLAVLLFFICELLAERVIIRRKKAELLQSYPLILVPVCSVVVIVALYYNRTCSDADFIIVSTGLLVLNFLMLYLYNQLLDTISEKYENEMLRQRVRTYSNQVDVILQSEERVKALRHDMKHHLSELNLLAYQYQVQEIQDYIKCMEEFMRNPNEIVASGNWEIDSVLNYMLQKARSELNDVEVKVTLPEHLKHSFDINVLLGNLLENAMEAAGKTEEKYLNVALTWNKGIMKIKVENSFLERDVVLLENSGKKTLQTTKQEKKEHGIGLKSVGEIVERYHGAMDISMKDTIFCVNVILYMQDKV